MIALPSLCQTLLNGPIQAESVQAAEHLLDTALADAAPAAGNDPTAPGDDWRIPMVPGRDASLPEADWLRALAPVFLLDGVWLARTAQPLTGHRPAQGFLLRIYTETVGMDQPASAPSLRYRARLVQAGVDLPPLASPRFFLDACFPDSALRFAALHLTLRQRPVSRFPELLGYTLAHLSRAPEWFDDPATQPLRQRHRAWTIEALELARAEGIDERRVQAGWRLYVAAFTALAQDMESRNRSPFTYEALMAAIVRTKLPQALGYHGKVRLQKKSLDEWLSEKAENPGSLLRALRESPWVDRACPEASRLIRAMDFGGPMFGVFNRQERKATLGWIGHPAAPSPITPPPLGAPRPRATHDPAPLHPSVLTRQSPRELYLSLLCAETPADASAAAEQCVHHMLRRTRQLSWLGLGTRRPAWSPTALREFAEHRHQTEVRRYQPRPRPPKADKAFCHWALMQLAPAILVDGAWLAGIPDAAEKLGATNQHLLKIYVDELGAGRPDWNHPNVYRRLLDSQGIRLPAFDSKDFAQSPSFIDAAFAIPVYLLAMGLATDRFRPELLGLNLAIELGGLGATYLRAIDILRQHGMDPTIIQLHLSIDNLASGHAARACDAIELALEAIRQREGHATLEMAWRRIWLGYDSLQIASISLTAGIVSRYFLHRVGWRVPVVGKR